MIPPVQFWVNGGMLATVAAGDDVRHGMLYFIPVLIIGVGAFIWAAFIRKAKKRRKRIHRAHTWELKSGDQRGAHRLRRSGRRRSAQHKGSPINPTLAETGGLPPVRPDDLSEPPSIPR